MTDNNDVCYYRELVLHGEDTASQIENGLHLPTFTSDAHGNLRTKIETGERDYALFQS